eukprot:UN19430
MRKKILPQIRSSNIAKVFTNKKNELYLRSYKVFVNRIPLIEQEIKSHSEESPRFKRLVAESDGQGPPLKGLLLLPVQRLPRYALLLKNLLKETSATHRDYDNNR